MVSNMGLLDNLTKNPSLIALAALGIALFVFRDKISGFFSDITGGAQGTAQIAETGGILARNLQSNLTATPLPEDPLFGEKGVFTSVLPEAAGATGDFFGGIFSGITDFFGSILNPLPEAGGEVAIPVAPIPTPDLSIPVAPSIAPTVIAPFQGGGPSFEGGQIFETPVENLSLSQIIDRFMVTASQAADIRAQAIGFTPEETTFLNQGQEISSLGDLGPQTSDPQFQGQTPEEIFRQLVGGVISNF